MMWSPATQPRNPWAEVAFLASPPFPGCSQCVVERMARDKPPYRAENFGKRPWVIVGSRGWNMLGVVFWSEPEAIAALLNRAASHDNPSFTAARVHASDGKPRG